MRKLIALRTRQGSRKVAGTRSPRRKGQKLKLSELVLLEVSAGKEIETVKTTPQMTRFRDVKVCKNLVTDEIDDHGRRSDYNMNCNIQKERTLHLVLRLRSETEHDTNDNVTTKTQSTFHTAHMNFNT